MQKKEKIESLRCVLGFENITKGDELVFICKNPNGCRGNHHKAKLSVNLETDEFHCWVCGWSGSSLKKIFKLGDRNSYKKYCLENLENENTLKKKEIIYDIPVLPDEFISLSSNKRSIHFMDAMRYVLSRGLNKKDILKYKLGYCEEGDYKHRIIIPSFDENGYLNFFVGRKIFNYLGIPYKHENFSKDIIFNDYLIDWELPITIVEGPFDAMIAGNNSIPLQGKFISENSKLFKKIVKKNSTVYLALDSDARNTQMKLIKLFYQYGVEVYDVKYPFKDVADSGKVFVNFIKSAKKIETGIDLMKIRVSQ